MGLPPRTSKLEIIPGQGGFFDKKGKNPITGESFISWKSRNLEEEGEMVFPIARKEEKVIRMSLEAVAKLPNQVIRAGTRMMGWKRDFEGENDQVFKFFIGLGDIQNTINYMRMTIQTLTTQLELTKNKRISKQALLKLEAVNEILNNSTKNLENAKSITEDQRKEFLEIPLIRILDEAIRIKEYVEDILWLENLLQISSILKKNERLEKELNEVKEEIKKIKRENELKEREDSFFRKTLNEKLEEIGRNKTRNHPESWKKWAGMKRKRKKS